MKNKLIAVIFINLFIALLSSTILYGEELESFTGVVIEKPWTKSIESWNAGGSEYYVLKATDKEIPPEKRDSEDGVILRPSKEISFEKIAAYKDRRVKVRGVFVEGKPYKPKNNMEQAPQTFKDPFSGKVSYPTRGSGFKVLEIKLMENKKQKKGGQGGRKN